jgi:CheY-like chemotaxis protein
MMDPMHGSLIAAGIAMVILVFAMPLLMTKFQMNAFAHLFPDSLPALMDVLEDGPLHISSAPSAAQPVDGIAPPTRLRLLTTISCAIFPSVIFLRNSCQTERHKADSQRLRRLDINATLKEGTMGLGRILVVDDEAHIRATVNMVLSKAGYDVVEAENGERGIHAITSGDNSLMVDMILCDMQMPKIDGVGAITHFQAQFPSVPVVVMTGHPDVQAATKLMKQGVKDYLIKPIEKEKLLAVVGEAVKERVRSKN